MILKNKVKLLAAIFLALTILWVLFLIKPLYEDIKGGSQEIISKKQELFFLESKIENIIQFRKKYQEIKPNLERINSLLIKGGEPVDFIRFLERISQDSQISVKIYPSSVTKVEGDPWPSMNFRINTVGTLPNSLKFLEKLDSAPYLIKIQNLNIKKLTQEELPEGSISESVETNFIIKVFSK